MKKKSLCLLAILIGVFYLSLSSCQKDNNTTIYNVQIDGGSFEIDLNGDNIKDVQFYQRTNTWAGFSNHFSINELHPQAEILAMEYPDTFYTAFTFNNYGTCQYTANSPIPCSDSCTSRVDTFIYPQLFDNVSINNVFNFIPAASNLFLYDYVAPDFGEPPFCTSPYNLSSSAIYYGSLKSADTKALVVRLNGAELYAIYFSGTFIQTHTHYYKVEKVVKLN